MSASHREHEPERRRPYFVDSDAAALNDIVQEARTAQPVSGAEQDRLLHQAALGDKSSQERLVAAHLDLVIRLAEARGVQSLSMPDLVQEGSIGLVQAVRSFTESGESDFGRFAQQLHIAQDRHRKPPEDELAEKLEWTVQRTRYVAQVVADARRRHDEEMLEFIDPEAIDFDGDEHPAFGS